MDTTDEIRLRLRISKLEAQVEMCDIESADLKRILNSPRTSAIQHTEALQRSETLERESAKLSRELKELRRTHPDLARR